MIKYKFNSKVIGYLLLSLRQDIVEICLRLGSCCNIRKAQFDVTHYIFEFELREFSSAVYESLRDLFDFVSVDISPDGSAVFTVLYFVYESE